MRWGWGPESLALLLLLLAQLTLPGDGNEGSRAGSCRCDRTFSSGYPPVVQAMEYFRKKLENYDRCPLFVRFHLPYRTVCGGSKDLWVIELISCFDQRECGLAYYQRVFHQEHLPSPSTQVPKTSERAPAVTDIPAQTYLPLTLQSTQQPTLPVEVLALDKNLTHTNETTTSSVGHSLEVEENQKQMDENVGPTAKTSVMVPVLSLLGIVFILTVVILYLLCNKRKQSLHDCPDLQIQYTRVATDSSTWAKNGNL
ncbi:C-X-C motif chemokine 16 [Molossus molossus]|uniref:C-X-C motif chemokine 16 n=1 Tax=Molossus molossus TaxID=27622 RepID=A0A7J8CXE3_MOLMO|nr:C-X-C motif chemokine 16 [Molossus molossus]KAF6415436.1 C-X-C motif chemokine ligand 16 [Molossus molossus]